MIGVVVVQVPVIVACGFDAVVSYFYWISTRTVIRLAERGELTAFKIGDLWRFRGSDVDDYIRQQIQRRQQS